MPPFAPHAHGYLSPPNHKALLQSHEVLTIAVGRHSQRGPDLKSSLGSFSQTYPQSSAEINDVEIRLILLSMLPHRTCSGS